MSDENSQAESDLQQLGKRVRSGWAKLHPVMPRHLEVVREAVRKQWEMEKGKNEQAAGGAVERKAAIEPTRQEPGPRQEESQRRTPPPAPPPAPKSKDRDWGHGH